MSEEGSGSQTQSLHGDGVCIEIKKLGRNSRRIRSKIEIDASLDTVWHILTDYEKLADFVPNLAVSQVVEKNDNFVRLYQVFVFFIFFFSILYVMAGSGACLFRHIVFC